MTAHVVWDWNGTLLADVDAVVAASRHSLAAIGADVDLDLAGYRATFRRPLRGFYDDLVGRPVDDREWATLGASFARHYAEAEPALPLADGAADALGRLRAAGVGQSLLSLHRHDELVTALDRRDLRGWFARTDGDRRGATGAGAGKAAALVEHLGALGLDPAGVVLVGDTVDDALAAAGAGTSCVLVAEHSTHDVDALRAVRPAVPVVGTLSGAVDVVLG